MSIQLISASDAFMRKMAYQTAVASQRVGYSTRRFNLQPDSYGEWWPVPERYAGFGRSDAKEHDRKQRERIVGVSPWKPSLLAHILSQEVDQTKTFVWIDADAWVIRKLDSLESGFFDIAVTMRRKIEREKTAWPDVYGYLNAGVVVVRPTPQAMKFLKMWQLEVDRTISKSDQHALNNLVRKATDLTHVNRIFKLEDIKIKVVSTDDFNNYYAPEEPKPTTAILHFKHDVRMREDMSIWIEKTKPENL